MREATAKTVRKQPRFMEKDEEHSCKASLLAQEAPIGDPSKLVRYHGARAEAFRSHADRAKEASTREMYFRLARTEDALADQAQQQIQFRSTSGVHTEN